MPENLLPTPKAIKANDTYTSTGTTIGPTDALRQSQYSMFPLPGTSHANPGKSTTVDEDKNRRICQRKIELKARKKLSGGFAAIENIRQEEGGATDEKLSNADKAYWIVDRYKSKSRDLDRLQETDRKIQRLQELAVKLGIEQGPDFVIDIEMLVLHLHNQLIVERARNGPAINFIDFEDFAAMYMDLPDNESGTEYPSYA